MKRFGGIGLAPLLVMVLASGPTLATGPQDSRSGQIQVQTGQALVEPTSNGLQILVKSPMGESTTFVFNSPTAAGATVPRLLGSAEIVFLNDGVVAIFHETAEAVAIRVDGFAVDLRAFVPPGYRLMTYEGGALVTKRPATRSTKGVAVPNRDSETPAVYHQDPGDGGAGGGNPGCAKSCSKTCGTGENASSCSCTAGVGFCCECTCSATSGATCGTSRG